jgi:hypothetical protein
MKANRHCCTYTKDSASDEQKRSYQASRVHSGPICVIGTCRRRKSYDAGDDGSSSRRERSSYDSRPLIGGRSNRDSPGQESLTVL